MQGAIPKMVNKIIPGIRKSSKKDVSSIDIGNPINSPEGEIINEIPPYRAPNAKREWRKTNKNFIKDELIIIAEEEK